MAKKSKKGKKAKKAKKAVVAKKKSAKKASKKAAKKSAKKSAKKAAKKSAKKAAKKAAKKSKAAAPKKAAKKSPAKKKKAAAKPAAPKPGPDGCAGAGARIGARPELGYPGAVRPVMGVRARPTAATSTRRSPAGTRFRKAAASTAAAFFVRAVRGDRMPYFHGQVDSQNALSAACPAAGFSGSTVCTALEAAKNCCGNATPADNIYSKRPERLKRRQMLAFFASRS